MRKLLPMAPGNRWSYKVSTYYGQGGCGNYHRPLLIQRLGPGPSGWFWSERGDGSFRDLEDTRTISYRVAGPGPVAGSWIVSACVNDCPKGPGVETWALVSARETATANSFPLYFASRTAQRSAIMLPNGRDWTSVDSTGDTVFLWGRFTAKGVLVEHTVERGPVVTPAGKFSQCTIQKVQWFKGHPQSEEAYFAPGHGLVKKAGKDQQDRLCYLMELTEHSVK